MERPPLWILEDDPHARFVYEEALSSVYSLRFFAQLSELPGTAEPGIPRGMIADLRLPDGEFLEWVRGQASRTLWIGQIPFLVSSSLEDLAALRDSYAVGARDYLVKPFRKSELLVKLERMLAGSQKELHLVTEALQLARGDQRSETLTSKEFQILSALLKRPIGETVPRAFVLEAVWGATKVSHQAFDVHLSHLRRKIACLSVEIEFVAPQAYRVAVLPQANG